MFPARVESALPHSNRSRVVLPKSPPGVRSRISDNRITSRAIGDISAEDLMPDESLFKEFSLVRERSIQQIPEEPVLRSLERKESWPRIFEAVYLIMSCSASLK